MKKQPHYLQNPFLTAFIKSHKRLLTLLNHYIGSLEAGASDQEIALLLNQMKALYQQYAAMYEALLTSAGLRKGETTRLTGAFDELAEKLRRWNLQVKLEYPEKTPEYIAIFSGGLTIFHRGTIEQQIMQTFSLAERLAGYSKLAAVHDEVLAYAQTIQQNRESQQKHGGTLDATSDELDAKRIEICNLLYSHLGWFIWKNPANPELIEKFFPYHLMRTHKKDENGNENGDEDGETLAIPPASVKASGITFTDDTPFSFYNSGHVALGIYTATDANTTVPAGVHILQPDEELEITASGLGNAGNTLLLVNNPDANTAGELEINIME